MRLKKIKDANLTIKSSPYYVEPLTTLKGKWIDLFKNNNPIHLEIGTGKGRFIIEMAKKHPDINFIGVEKYDSVLVKAVKSLGTLENPLDNLKLILFDAENINDIFEKDISLLYLNFSDPWPKSKHEKRRLTSHRFLEKYDSIFVNEKRIVQKTDNKDFFDFSLESIKSYGYTIDEVTYDLHSLNETENVETEYEQKFSSKGVKINRLKATKDN